MNPDVIIKLEEYQKLIKESKELEELKNKVEESELLEYLNKNPTVNFGLSIRSLQSAIDDVTLDYHVVQYDCSKPFPYDLIRAFIYQFNQALDNKRKEVLEREENANINAKKYFKTLSLIQKLKLIWK